jgi:hypothetical protein
MQSNVNPFQADAKSESIAFDFEGSEDKFVIYHYFSGDTKSQFLSLEDCEFGLVLQTVWCMFSCRHGEGVYGQTRGLK